MYFDHYYFSQQPAVPHSESVATDWPNLDIYEEDAAHVIVMDIPGVLSEDLDVKTKESTLTISGTRQTKEGHRNERHAGAFSRSINLKNADIDKIEAVRDNGVLTITVPKADTSRKIPVSSSS